MKTHHTLSGNLATLFACLFFGMFSFQTALSQCPTVANTTITTCAFDGTSLTTVGDLETLVGVSGTTDVVVWYNAITGGTQYSDTDIISDGIYYLDTDTAACSPRIAVTITVNAETPICIDGDCDGDFFCESSMATIQEILDEFSGMNLEVSNTPGGTALPATTLLVSTVYWVTQTEAGCTSNPLPYNVIIQQVAPPVVVDPFPFFCQPPSPTIADIAGSVTGSLGFWYADASLSVVLPSSTPLIDGEDYFTYALFGTCRSDVVSVTVTIGETPEAGTFNPNPLQFCDDGDISDQALTDYGITDINNVDLSSLLSGQDTGGVWTDDNSTGEISSGSDTVINLENLYTLYQAGTITQTSFTYTVTNSYNLPDGSSDTCEDTATVNIVFDPILTAGTATDPLVICETNIPANTPVDLFSLLTGEDSGGTWSDDTGSCVSLATPTTVDISCLTPGDYTYSYTVNQITTCPPETETVTITITEAPDLAINSPENFCITDNTTGNIDLFTYLTTDSSGGTGTWTDTSGTGALTLPSTVNITTLQGLGDGSYTFNYLVDNGAGCTNDINMVVIIDPENEAGTPSNTLICETNLVNNFDLFTLLVGNDTGGTWSDDEATGALTGNIIDLTIIPQPYDATGYDFTYTASNASCPDDTTTVTITLSDVPEAGTGSNQIICITPPDVTSIDLFSLLTGEDLGGTWTDLSNSGALTLPSSVLVNTLQGLGAGTYIYEYNIDNGDGCTNSSQVSITIESIPEPVNAIIDICLTDLVTGTTPFTDLDSLVTTPGDPITVNWAVSGTTPITSLTDTLTGTIDWGVLETNAIVGATTSYTFEPISNTAVDCVPDLGEVTINVIDIPAPTYTGSGSYCPNNGNITIQDIIDDFSASLGGAILIYNVATGGTPLNPTDILTPNTYTFYGAEQDTVGAGCESNPRAIINITVNQNSDAGINNTYAECITVASGTTINLFDELGGTPDNGGSWTGPIATTNGDQGTIDISSLPVGQHDFVYTVTGIAPCPNATATIQVFIDPLPNAGTDGTTQNLCNTDTTIDLFGLLGGTPTAGGTWSPALASGTGVFDPSIDSSNTYTYTITNSCGTASPAAQITVNVTPTPDITNPGNQTACGSITLDPTNITGLNLTGNENYYDSPGGAGNIVTTINTLGDTTVYIYDATNPTVCSDQEMFTVTILAAPDITPISPAPVCDSFTFPPIGGTGLNNALYNTAMDGSGTTYAVSSIFTPTTAGDYTFYMIDTVGTCTEVESFTITINQTSNPGTDSTHTNCITDVPYTLIEQLDGVPNTGGNWYLSTDTAFTNPLGDDTFMFNPASDFPDTTDGTSVTYVYQVTAIAPCNDVEASLTLTLNNPGLPTAQDQSFCAIDGATVADLIVNGIGGYTWYDTNVSTTALAETELLVDGEDYWVSQDDGCESLRVQINVTISDPGAPNLLTDNTEFCINDGPTLELLEANIDNPNGYQIIWYDAETGGNPITSLSLLLTHGQTYYASYFVDPCESEIRVAITVNLTACDSIVIPDAFSPNNDGQNDTYTIPNIGLLYPNYTIDIYNRYGNVVYKGNINTADFDGSSNQGNFLSDDILPVGVYFYILDFKDGVTKPKQGRLYLSR